MTLLLLMILMKRSKLDKDKYKIWKSKRKGAPGSVKHLSLVLKEMKDLKKSLMLSRVTSGQSCLQ